MAGAAERGHGRGGLTVRIGTGSARPAPGRASHHYAGRVAALATMHGKEAAIAPPLSQRLGLRVCVPDPLMPDASAALQAAGLGGDSPGNDLPEGDGDPISMGDPGFLPA